MKNKVPLTGISSVAMHAAGHNNAEDAHLTPIFATSTFTFDSTEEGMNRFAGPYLLLQHLLLIAPKKA